MQKHHHPLPHDPRMARRFVAILCLIGAVVGISSSAALGVGCGGTSAVHEARIGKLRVRVSGLELPRETTDTPAQRDTEFQALIDEAEAIEQFRLGAEIATFWGRFYEARHEYDLAAQKYRLALRYDKREHYRLRSPTNPLPNSTAIAVSLANLSLVLEKKGDIETATQYAERAFRINRALNLPHRVRIDALRLSRLHEKLGNVEASRAFHDVAQEVALSAASSPSTRHARPDRAPNPLPPPTPHAPTPADNDGGGGGGGG